jgi:hypothetical protein
MGGDNVMKNSLTLLAATAAIAVAVMGMATTAEAQVVIVSTNGIYAPQPFYPFVCEVRREQFSDEHGWRVRDVLVCVTR